MNKSVTAAMAMMWSVKNISYSKEAKDDPDRRRAQL